MISRVLRVVRGEDEVWSSRFEVAVQIIIILSLINFSLFTIKSFSNAHRSLLQSFDIILAALFATEYALRITAARDKLKYMFSVWGIIDFLAIVPTLLVTGLDLKPLRVLLILEFARILKLGRYATGLTRLINAFRSVLPEFVVFFAAASILLFLASTGIYYLEREAQPDVFGSIPAALWWAIVTLATVGYGDAYPVTAAGKLFTGGIVMIGLCLVGVPAGLIAAALVDQKLDEEQDDDDAERHL